MKLKLFSKFTTVMILVLVISSSVSSSPQNPQNVKIIKNSCTGLSYEEIIDIKNQFLDFEKNYSGVEKIKHQLGLIHDLGIINSTQTIDTLLSLLETMKQTCARNAFFKNIFSSRNVLVSHFTINGRIKGVLPLRRQPFYFQYINESSVSAVGGFLPVYLGTSSNEVYITAINCKNYRTFEKSFSHFIELMIPCLGFSVAFIDSSNQKVMFEYNLDLCFFGLLFGS